MADRPRLKTPFDPPAPKPESPAPAHAPPRERPGRFRFGTRAFFGFSFLVAFACAGYGGMTASTDAKAYWVVFSLVAPLAAVMIAWAAHKLSKRFFPPVDRRRVEDSSPFDC